MSIETSLKSLAAHSEDLNDVQRRLNRHPASIYTRYEQNFDCWVAVVGLRLVEKRRRHTMKDFL